MFLLTLMICRLVFSQESEPIITVLNFQTNNVSEWDMTTIISLLSSALFNTGKYRVIDIDQRETILAEQDFSVQDCADEACQIEIGRLLSAEMIVVGNIGLVGERYVLTAKILETETADTLNSTDGIFQNLNALIDNIYAFAEKLSSVRFEVAEKPSVVEAKVKKKPERKDQTVGPTRVAAFVTLGTGVYFFISGLLCK